MKKIAIIHPEYVVRGGAERKSLIYASMLCTDYDVTVLCGNYDSQNTFSEYARGLTIVTFPYRSLVGKLISLVRIGWRCRQYDVIIANNYPVTFSAGLAKWLFEKKVIWFCNEPSLYLAKSNNKGKIIAGILKTVERWCVTRFDVVIANSRYTKHQIMRRWGIEADVIYSGLDLELFAKVTKEAPQMLESRPKRLICVSRMEMHKGITTLLALFERIESRWPDVELRVVGSGRDLESIMQKWDKPNILFLGACSENEKIDLLCASDVFVFPAKDEPLGVTPIEAMAAGLPVVAFQSGGVTETIIHGTTGYLVNSDDAFVDSVVDLLAHSEKAKQFGQNGIQHAHQHFSKEKMTEELHSRLEKVIRMP